MMIPFAQIYKKIAFLSICLTTCTQSNDKSQRTLSLVPGAQKGLCDIS